ncbi:LysR family transcriptional regulator [Rhizobium johnstonii]|uniref:LysR family transcriptional regulator n=1 Tax=Rhizobium johnstonii TaxID=3019933 RepID=UPI003F9D0EBE
MERSKQAISSCSGPECWLRVFEAAASHQSFVKAGRDLNMPAAAVSQQVLTLETHLGRPLFLRKANKVILTPDASDFLPTVQVSLGTIQGKAAALFERQTLLASIRFSGKSKMGISWSGNRGCSSPPPSPTDGKWTVDNGKTLESWLPRSCAVGRTTTFPT